MSGQLINTPRPEQIKDQALRLNTSLKRLVEIIREGGDQVINGQINPLDNHLILYKKDGTQIDVGAVGAKGEPGSDGISIIDVQLIEDPEQNNNVFVQTELSNGVILQTQKSLNGYHGKSVEAVKLVGNDFVFTLEGGIDLDPIPVDGIQPIGIAGARVSVDKELIFDLTDGSELETTGLAALLKGRGVNRVFRQAGKLFIEYDDETGTVQLGDLVGLKNIEMRDGHLIITKDTDVEQDLGPLMAFTGARVDDGNLILTTNQLGADAEIDLGPVQNLKGKDGLSIKSVDVRDDKFFITLSDDSELPGILVSGITPISVTNARFDVDKNEVMFILSDGTEIASGIGADFKGESLEDVKFDKTTGQFFVKFTNDSAYREIAVIPMISSFNITADGKVQVTMTDDPTPRDVGTVRYAASVNLEPDGKLITTFSDGTNQESGTIIHPKSLSRGPDGEITLTYNDDTTESLGFMISLEDISLDANSDLFVTITGQQPKKLGNIKGVPGTSLKLITLDERGHLIVTDSDDKIHDAGFARTTIQNLLGQKRTFTGDQGPDFPLMHNGEVLVWKNQQLVGESELDLTVQDTVTYKGAIVPEDEFLMILFVPGGPSETGRGLFKFEAISATAYQITLEDGTPYVIETETIIQPQELPPGIKSAVVDNTTGHLIITLTDDTTIDAGTANKAINTKATYIDQNGDLHIVLDDDTDLNAGSVISNIKIERVFVNPDGDLIIELTGGGAFNAGPTANYVTDTYIDANDVLHIVTSDGRDLEAGAVRSPVLGTIYHFTTYDGQTEINIAHGEFLSSVKINGIGIAPRHYDVDTDPNKIILKHPRVANDEIEVTLFAVNTVKVSGLESEIDAPNETFYGKDKDGNVGWHPIDRQMFARPKEVKVLNDNTSSVFFISSGIIDVIKNGKILHEDEYSVTAGNDGIDFVVPVNKSDSIRVIDYSIPTDFVGFNPANITRVSYQTFSSGGSITSKVWAIRQLNEFVSNGNGFAMKNNRLFVPKGIYKLDGHAAIQACGQTVFRIRDLASGNVVWQGGPQYAGLLAARQTEQTDFLYRINGYMELPEDGYLIIEQLSAVSVAGYGQGTGNAAGRSTGVKQDHLGIPGRLLDVSFERVNIV